MSWLLGGACILGFCVWMIGRFSRSSNWKISDNGNKTKIVRGRRITIFQSDGGWKYCIADEHDRFAPYFSEKYETEFAATESAMAEMEGRDSPHMSTREQRDERLRERAIALIEEDAPTIYSNALSKITEMHTRQRFTLTELRPIHKRISKLRSGLLSAFPYKHDAGDERATDDMWSFYDKVKSLEEHTQALIQWREAEGRTQKTDPPALPALN